MTSAFKKRFRRAILWLVAGFVLLFGFRLMYGYTKKTDRNSVQSTFFESISGRTRNIASKKYDKMGDVSSPVPSGAVKVDQKYEKIANIQTQSGDFEQEEKKARGLIEANQGLIQFEQKSGNNGARRLQLLIGVPPENFDKLYESLVQIGKVQSRQISKKDKTNEYKELNARKASLEKIRTSLISLKEKSGKIEEYMDLENRILDIEQQLQSLGVSLGDFDSENEFCTVEFSMAEGKEVQISFLHRLKVAFEWTVRLYFRLMMTLAFLLGAAYLFLLTLDKLKIIQAMLGKGEPEDSKE